LTKCQVLKHPSLSCLSISDEVKPFFTTPAVVQVSLGGLQGVREGVVVQVVARKARHQPRGQQALPVHRRRLSPTLQHPGSSLLTLASATLAKFVHENVNDCPVYFPWSIEIIDI
jgi:hypothetical protein